MKPTFVLLAPLLALPLAACLADPEIAEATSAICATDDCGGTTTTPTYYDYYCGVPEIRAASILNAHECTGPSSLGCNRAFMYFGEAGTEKTSDLPSKISSDYFNTDVWASNFQGPYDVYKDRQQFEFGTSGGADYQSGRVYPATYATSCAHVTPGAAPATPPSRSLHVYEDDEWPNSDDYVGAMGFSYAACTTDVFSKGLRYGWTTVHGASVSGDVGSVSYRLWCWKCLDAQQCGLNVAPGVTF